MLNELKVIAGVEGVGRFKMGILELNAPKVLNAVDTSMLEKIGAKFKSWAIDPEIACIVMFSKSERAFCAGGDVKNLVREFRSSGAMKIAQDFFTTEYYVDHFIHTVNKPTVCIADGVTMGGGMGLMQGCRARIVTERTLLSMPEISIGLFPDVGAGYFLNKIPNKMGRFLGLTGARFLAGDAIRWGLADYFIDSNSKTKLLVDLMRLPWIADQKQNISVLHNYFLNLSSNSKAPSMWEEIEAELAELVSVRDIRDFDELISTMEIDHKGFQEAKTNYIKGSPISKRLIFTALVKMEAMSLRQVFETEWDMAIECSLQKDFSEGVRALLIDKDQIPKWEQKTIPSEEWIRPYFQEHSPHLLKRRFSEEFD